MIRGARPSQFIETPACSKDAKDMGGMMGRHAVIGGQRGEEDTRQKQTVIKQLCFPLALSRSLSLIV